MMKLADVGDELVVIFSDADDGHNENVNCHRNYFRIHIDVHES